MPRFPRIPSWNNIEKWLKARKEMELAGIELLTRHYSARGSEHDFESIRMLLERRSVSRSALQSENERLQALLLALATDHVPFFTAKEKKRATVDNHLLARLLRDYQQEIKSGRTPRSARSKAARKLPGKLANASDARIKNLLAKARTAFRNLVVLTSKGSLRPIRAREAHIWQFLLESRAPSDNRIRARREPHATDRDGIVIVDLHDPPITK